MRKTMKRLICTFLSLLLLVALVGCQVQFPDDLAADSPSGQSDIQAPLAGPGGAGAADDSSTSGSGSGSSGSGSFTSDKGQSDSALYYDVEDSPLPGMDAEEYQRYINDLNTRRPSDFEDTDAYGTTPVPDGMPQPVEWQDAQVDPGVEYRCTLYIECGTILNNMDQFNLDKLEVLPQDGVVFAAQTVTFSKGESVFDVLLRETQKNRIHMAFRNTPIYNSNYIEAIGNLYEKDCGPLSGWMYCVNGWYPNYGCSRYELKDGDVIQWRYTCDLGADLGVTWVEQS